MKYSNHYGFWLPEAETDNVDIDVLNQNFEDIDTVLSHHTHSGGSDGAKLPATSIIESASKRFVSDTEKAEWNVSINDRTPTYTEASSLANLVSGEKLSVAFGKIKKAVSSFISHLSASNPHINAAYKYDAVVRNSFVSPGTYTAWQKLFVYNGQGKSVSLLLSVNGGTGGNYINLSAMLNTNSGGDANDGFTVLHHSPDRGILRAVRGSGSYDIVIEISMAASGATNIPFTLSVLDLSGTAELSYYGQTEIDSGSPTILFEME